LWVVVCGGDRGGCGVWQARVACHGFWVGVLPSTVLLPCCAPPSAPLRTAREGPTLATLVPYVYLECASGQGERATDGLPGHRANQGVPLSVCVVVDACALCNFVPPVQGACALSPIHRPATQHAAIACLSPTALRVCVGCAQGPAFRRGKTRSVADLGACG
jgi:hypothetical protein